MSKKNGRIKFTVRKRKRDIDRAKSAGRNVKDVPFVLFCGDKSEVLHGVTSVTKAREICRRRQNEEDNRRIEGTHDWGEARDRYLDYKRGLKKAPDTLRTYRKSFEHYERIMRPKVTADLTAEAISEFTQERLSERHDGRRGGLRAGSTTSPSTVTKDLRNLKGAANKWFKWKRLEEVPDFAIEDVHVPKELQRHVTEEHYAALMEHADAANRPVDLPRGETADWWRALLTFCFTTGWRIHSEVLELGVSDLDLSTGAIITWARDNKASESVRCYLDPSTLELVGRVVSAKNEKVFEFEGRRVLYDEFALIQDAAGINLPCERSQKHECSEHCHRYGFHDFRRSCATLNLGILSQEELRQLMRHSSYKTTQGYIKYAQNAAKRTSEKAYVPAAARLAASA